MHLFFFGAGVEGHTQDPVKLCSEDISKEDRDMHVPNAVTMQGATVF